MRRTNGHLLQVSNLHLERERYEILRGVNLAVDRGTVHVVLGLNGSGKSTLAYTLIGSAGYAPSNGQIRFDVDSRTGMQAFKNLIAGRCFRRRRL